MTLTDRSVRDLLAALRSPDPTPGGGSASALAGAMGAALLAMVAGLGKPRAHAAGDLERLMASGRACAALSEELTELIDRDSEAYDAVVAAYRLPKETDADKRARSARIQDALTGATLAPLEIMRACAGALEHAAAVAAGGNANASSDVHVAIELLSAGLLGAKRNVDINLGGLKDAERAAAIRSEAGALEADSARLGREARAALPAAT